MQKKASLFRSGVLCLAAVLLAAGHSRLLAESDPENLSTKAVVPDELSQAELLKSYLHVREQLHTAELAIANNRLEAEATARAQAAAIAEKLDSIKSVIASERERQEAEAQRIAADQERQRLSSQESSRIILWIAAAFGGVGVLTLIATALLQWRGIRRMTEVTAHRPPVGGSPQGWLTTTNPGPLGDTVALSNQRLMSVIDRMERRILELESTGSLPSSAANPELPAEQVTPRTAVSVDQAARIAATLGKGRSLLNANKAAEAVECYDEILAIDANHPEALVKKGSALERLQRDQEALECYDRAIKADQNMALAYLSKGGVFNRLQRFDEAVECYERALQAEKVGKPISVTRVSVAGDWGVSGSSVPA